jgi:dCTP deaminase
MSILSDRWIREQSLANGMIEPFVDGQKRDGVISYGLSSYGGYPTSSRSSPTSIA